MPTTCMTSSWPIRVTRCWTSRQFSTTFRVSALWRRILPASHWRRRPRGSLITVMNVIGRKLAVVTDVCSGMGLELARLCARQGFDLIVLATEDLIHDVAQELRQSGTNCTAVQCSPASPGGIASLMAAIAGAERPVDFLFAHASRVVHTNIDSTVRLVFAVAAGMRTRGQGRILISGSVSGLLPGPLQAVYNGSKAFLDSFAAALSTELQGTGVTVTSLLPGTSEAVRCDCAAVPATHLARLAFDALVDAPAPLEQRHPIALQQVLDGGRLHP